MCYLVREQQAAAAAAASATPGRGQHPRARWIGAVTAALVGGIALAALDAPKPAPPAPTVQAREAATAFPVAARSSVMPPAALERTGLPVDDGVPGATDMAKERAGDCQHGL